MGFPKRVHDPDAVLDYPSNWTAWLPEGDTITNATAMAKDPLTGAASTYFAVDSVTHTDTYAVAMVSASADSVGKKATLTFHITTAEGREDDRSMTLVGQER